MENWFAARTIVGHEAPVAARLARYETFLPISLERYFLFGKRKERRFPLFPGYFFLRCEPDLRPTRRNDFFGLIGAEGVGIGEPLAIDDQIIVELQERRTDDGVIILPERFKIGDQVRVTEGALIDHVGLYQGQSTAERAIILISMFGRDCTVPIDTAALSPVEQCA